MYIVCINHLIKLPNFRLKRVNALRKRPQTAPDVKHSVDDSKFKVKAYYRRVWHLQGG